MILRCALPISLLACLVMTFEESVADAPESQNWNRFHGPGGYGVASGQLPSEWSDSDYQWQIELGSRDVSSPIVQGDNVFVLASQPNEKSIQLRCIDLATGDQRWARSYSQQPHHLHKRNTFASSTPVSDDQHVYFAFAEVDHTWLIAVGHDGQEVWRRDFGPWVSSHGFGTSPRIAGDKLVVLLSQQADQLDPGQEPGDSQLVALDLATGQTTWQSKLNATRTCYGTPAQYESKSGTQLIGANTGNGMFGIDSITGKMLWSKLVFEKRCCSTPLIVGDIAIGTSGSGGGGNHLVAVQIPDSGGQPKQLYRIDRNVPYVPTPVLVDERLFMIDDRGVASCINAVTGKTVWRNRIGGNFSASPIVVGRKLLIVSLEGIATTLSATDQFQKLGSVDLQDYVGATPAYADGRLLIRVGTKLCCL